MTKKRQLQLIGLFFFFLISFLIIKNKSNDVVEIKETTNENFNLINCSQVNLKTHIPKIEFSGRVKSIQRIKILSEVNGLSEITNSLFEVGEEFKKGEILLSIKDLDIELELKSVKSQFLALLVQVLPDVKMDFPQLGVKLQNYINNFSLNKKIENLPQITGSKEKTFLSSRQIFANYYKIKALENKLEKFQIKAPFNGVLTKALIDPGSNVIIGQPLGEFINPNKHEIATSVSISEGSLIKVNDRVNIKSEDLNENITGTVSRVGSHINELTQSIDLFIEILDGNVIDGMYVTGQIFTTQINNSHKLERSKIIEQNKIYTILDNQLKLKNIEIIAFQNDSALIKGVDENDCLVDQYRQYFYDGMNINSVK